MRRLRAAAGSCSTPRTPCRCPPTCWSPTTGWHRGRPSWPSTATGPGKSRVCGLEPDDEPGGDYAAELARRGHVVLAPDLRCFGERADWNPPDHYGCDTNLVHQVMGGWNPLTQNLWDLARALDVLEAHPLVDPASMGMAGFSYGGHGHAVPGRAATPGWSAAVVCGYFSSWAESHKVPWNMCGSQVLSGMLGRMEHADIGALVAPRPLLVVTGREDSLFPVAAAEESAARVQRVYDHDGAGDRLGHDVFEGEHQWHGDRAYPFLEQWLAAGEPAGAGRTDRRSAGRPEQSSRPESASKRTVAWAVRCRIDAGHAVVTGPAVPRRTGRPCGPRAPRPAPDRARSRAGMVTVTACRGTSASLAKWPSLTCWRRQASSRVTTLTSARVVEVGHRGVVEGQVPVLADAQAAQVERVAPQQSGVALALVVRRGQAVEVVGGPRGGSAPRSARGSSAGSWPDGRARSPRTRPCGRRRRRPRARRGSGPPARR